MGKQEEISCDFGLFASGAVGLFGCGDNRGLDVGVRVIWGLREELRGGSWMLLGEGLRWRAARGTKNTGSYVVVPVTTVGCGWPSPLQPLPLSSPPTVSLTLSLPPSQVPVLAPLTARKGGDFVTVAPGMGLACWEMATFGTTVPAAPCWGPVDLPCCLPPGSRGLFLLLLLLGN